MTSLQKWGKSVRTTIPVMAGYLVLGAGFGILLRTRGYGLGWALAMSAFIYCASDAAATTCPPGQTQKE